MFVPAERVKVWARVGLVGPSGSGKTYSSLLFASGLGSRIAVVDTEQGSAAMYSHLVRFDVAHLEAPYSVDRYLELIREAEKAGYDVIIVDSLSPAWIGKGGLLEEQEKKALALKSPFAAWRDIAPKYQALIEGILSARAHVICTFRAKTAYEVQDGPDGKKKPVKIGIAPQFREGIEYEFMIMFEILPDHSAIVWKDRTGLFDGLAEPLTEKHGRRLREWLESGRAVLKPEPSSPVAPTAEPVPTPVAEDDVIELAAEEEAPEEVPEEPEGLFAAVKPGSVQHMVLTVARARNIDLKALEDYIVRKYGRQPTTSQWVAVKRALERGLRLNGGDHG